MDNRSILSKELQLDKNLKLSNEEFQQIILNSMNSTATRENIFSATWPNDYVFVSLAKRVYSEEVIADNSSNIHGRIIDESLGNWQLLTVAYNDKYLNGYVGAAYWNPDMNQIIISHRGTKLTSYDAIFTDIQGILLNQHVYQIDSAVTFADKVIGVLKTIKENDCNMPYIHLFFTGHSLGGWLAQITTFTAKYVRNDGSNFIMDPRYEGTGYHPSAVVFDSPGAKCMLERIQDSLKNRYDSLHLLNTLDITCYLSAPNLINTCNPQVGTIYRIFLNFSENEKIKMQNSAASYVKLTHSSYKFKEIFDPVTGRVCTDESGELKILKMKDWPILISGDEEATIRDKMKWGAVQIAKILGNASIIPGILISVGEGVYSLYSKAKWYREFMEELNNFFTLAKEANDFHINEDAIDESPYRTIRYNYDEIGSSYKNEHSLTVFTVEEQQFLESFKLLGQYQQQLPDGYRNQNLFNSLQQIEGLKEKTMEMLNDYEIIKGVIKRSDNLHNFILFVKNIIFLFPKLANDVQDAVKRLPLHLLDSFYIAISTTYLTSIECPLEFQNDILRIRQFLNSNIKIMHAIHYCTSFGIGILYKSLLRHLNNTNWTNTIFLSLKRIFYTGNSLFREFLKRIRTNSIVVLECNSDLRDKQKMFIIDILESVKENGNIKIVFLTEKNNPFQEYLKEQESNNLLYQESVIQFKFSDLLSICQDKILDSTVICNGKETTLRSILGENRQELDGVIDADVIIKLVKNEIIEIGKPLPDLDSVKNYIFRRLLRKVKIRKDIFRSHDVQKDIFLISSVNNSLQKSDHEISAANIQNAEEGYFGTIIPINSDDAEDAFKGHCINNTGSNIHWLRKENDNYIWQRSRSSNLSKYRKFIENYDYNISEVGLVRNASCFEIIDSGDITKFKEKIIIISEEPGMGKSTFLKYVGNSITGCKLVFWINLVECNIRGKYFNTDDDIIYFLMGSSNPNTTSDTISRKIIKHCFNSSNCIVFLDGFDEILEKDQNSVLNLLKKLQNTTVKKVFISTTLHLRDKLEDAVSTFAYNLIPFSHEDQKQFLKKFWKHDIDPNIEDTTLDKYISELLQFLSQCIGDKERAFMGIPLQMKMVAEFFHKEMDNSLDAMQTSNSKPNFPKDFNVLKLYASFIDNKYKTYFEKIGVGKIDLSNPARMNLLTSGLRKLHAELAFEELFPDINVELKKYLVGEQQSFFPLKEDVNLVGLFQFIHERIIFTHPSFAEYFIADMLTRRLNSSIEVVRNCAIQFLSKKLFESENEVIKTFLDYNLANEPILFACLKGDLNSVRDDTAINVVDVLGRSGFHYAAQGGHKEIIDKLLEKKANMNMKDKLGKTALHYAARYNGSTNIIDTLVKQAVTNFINEKDANDCTSLDYAVQQGKWPLVELMQKML